VLLLRCRVASVPISLGREFHLVVKHIKDKIIYIKIGLILIIIKRRLVIVNFNILLLGNDKVVLEMLWL